MKALTLDEAKDEIAFKHFESNWKYMRPKLNADNLEKLHNEAAELFCQSQKAAAWEEGYSASLQLLKHYQYDDEPCYDLLENTKPTNPYKS